MYIVIEYGMEYGDESAQEYVYRVFGPFTEANAEAFVAKQAHKIDFRVQRLEDES